jgi:Tol biopolymer transport system component
MRPTVTASILRLALAVLAAAALLAVAAPPSPAAFPGRDGKLVFSWSSFSESELEPFPSRTESAIQVVGPRGGTPQTLRSCVKETGKPDVGDCSIGYASPAVAPNGRRIAFDAGNRLALMRFDGGGLVLLPQRGADDGGPAFSPGGRRLAFVAGAIAVQGRPAPPSAIWTSDLAGGQARQVTALGTAPSWSTRNWIAFVRDDGIYRIHPDGHGLRRLVALRRCSDVDWSPHGTRLAFTCTTPHSGGRLYLADGDGRHVHRVALRYASPQAVAWSPSGKRLAVTDFDGTLTTMRPDGSRPHDLLSGQAGANYSSGAGGVAWQPLR